MFKRLISFFVSISFILSYYQPVYAQDFSVNQLPVPGKMLSLSKIFTPILVKGLIVHPDKPLNFDFIVDSGNDSTDQSVIEEQTQRIAKYFLAAVTVPEDQLWVNLSPYEKDRVIENDLGQTILGRDMLAQDYVLKQLTASMIYPEDKLGKDFWVKVYKQAQEKFGTTNIPVNTFNKVWIMPEKAEVFERGNAVYITEAKLKVMLDSDRKAMMKKDSDGMSDDKAVLTKAIMREVILPAIEKEVNEGQNFAVIRQIYYTAILAKWYRELIQNTLLADVYVGKNRVAGVTSDDKAFKEEIYQRYIAAYKKGVFNYIKDEADASTGEILPRKYFSGGIEDFAMKSILLAHTTNPLAIGLPVGQIFKVDLAMNAFGDKAMMIDDPQLNLNPNARDAIGNRLKAIGDAVPRKVIEEIVNGRGILIDQLIKGRIEKAKLLTIMHLINGTKLDLTDKINGYWENDPLSETMVRLKPGIYLTEESVQKIVKGDAGRLVWETLKEPMEKGYFWQFKATKNYLRADVDKIENEFGLEYPSVVKPIGELVQNSLVRNEKEVEIADKIFFELIRRLNQRETVNWMEEKWLDRLDFAYWWSREFARPKKYTHVLVNIFGNDAVSKAREVEAITAQFREEIQNEADKGKKFFIYSGGSGVGKSTMWGRLTNEMKVGNKYIFKKFLMYTTRERRPDEDVSFKDDILFSNPKEPNKARPELYKALEVIIENRVPGWNIQDVNVSNVRAYKTALNTVLLAQRGKIKLSIKDKQDIDKMLDLKSLGENGKRIEMDPNPDPNKSFGYEISLNERLGWALDKNGNILLQDGKKIIRVFGEFHGVTYYFTSSDRLTELENTGKVKKFTVLGGLVQGVSVKDVLEKLSSKSNEIYVLETTPEIIEDIKNYTDTDGKRIMEGIVTFFIEPFDQAQISSNDDYVERFRNQQETVQSSLSVDLKIAAMQQKTIVVVGASGFLGKKIVKNFRQSQVPVFETGFTNAEGLYQLDVTNEEEIRAFVDKVHPDVIVYAAAEADPSRTQKDDTRARQLNVDAVGLFAKYFNGRFLYFSSDYVFDGTSAPYSVNAPTNAVNKYGETKIDGEGMTRQLFGKNATILRLGLLYGYNDENDRETFVYNVIRKLDDGKIVEADNQYVRHPVLVDDVAKIVFDVIKKEESGILHINGDVGVTKFQLAQIIADEYVKIFPQGGEEYKIKGLVVEKSENSVARPQNVQLVNSVVPTALRDGIRQVVRLISRRLKGGSFNKTDVYVKDGVKIVRKQALPNENGKLVNQIKYLLSVPESVKQYFPEVLDYSLGDEKLRDDERVRIQVEQIEKKLGRIGDRDVVEKVMRNLKDGTLVFRGKEVNVRADENTKSFLGRIDENIAKFLRYSYLIDKDAEVLDVIDPVTGNPTGEKAFRGDVHRKGLWHGVVHILVVNENTGKILTQVRAIREDINSSGKMDISAGGHIPSGMKPDEVAIKEGTEEIKLAPSEFKIFKVGNNFRASGSSNEAGDHWDSGTFYYKTSQNNNEVASLYIALTQVSAEELNKRIASINESGVHADEQEVGQVNYVGVNDLRDMVLNENQRDQMASPLRMYFGRGKELNNILQLIDNARKREGAQFIDIAAVFNNIPHDSVRPKIFYDMPYYQGKTLTNMIMDGDINAQQARSIVEKVMKIWSDDLVKSRREIAPDREYIQKQLIERTRQSLDQVRREAPEVFEKVLAVPFIVINGKRYKNALPLLHEISANKRLLEMLSPPRFLFTHGDFHFDNIFVTKDGSFKFIDPRGDFQGDPIYDLAKIGHTLEAKYDILNHDLEQTRLTVQDGQIEITVQYPVTTNVWKIYDELEKLMPEILQKAYIDTGLANKDPFWKERLLLSLAKIMTNLPIYHLKHDGKEERALALYAEGVKVLNDFIEVAHTLDNKMPGDDKAQLVANGGIDIQGINVNIETSNTKINFNDDAVRGVLKNSFNGFTPVIINITHIQSPFPLLGIAKDPKESAKA